MDVVCVGVEGLGLVIGQSYVVEGSVTSLEKPRRIGIIPPSKQGESPRIHLEPLIGAPKEIFFEQIPVYFYRVVDTDLLSHYTRATTVLQVFPPNVPIPPIRPER